MSIITDALQSIVTLVAILAFLIAFVFFVVMLVAFACLVLVFGLCVMVVAMIGHLFGFDVVGWIDRKVL